MNEYICDDRQDINKIVEEIDKMSDQEFEKYLEQIKSKEN